MIKEQKKRESGKIHKVRNEKSEITTNTGQTKYTIKDIPGNFMVIHLMPRESINFLANMKLGKHKK